MRRYRKGGLARYPFYSSYERAKAKNYGHRAKRGEEYLKSLEWLRQAHHWGNMVFMNGMAEEPKKGLEGDFYRVRLTLIIAVVNWPILFLLWETGLKLVKLFSAFAQDCSTPNNAQLSLFARQSQLASRRASDRRTPWMRRLVSCACGSHHGVCDACSFMSLSRLE